MIPGFTDPVHGAQSAFRRLLDASSQPGRVLTMDGGLPTPAGLMPASAAIALTLIDLETPLWLDARSREALVWLRFHTGAPVVAEPAQAAFALIGDPSAMPPLDSFSVGTDLQPDHSCTLIIEVAGLAEGEGRVLRGPGIEHRRSLAIDGLPDRFWAERRALMPLYPCGIDILLVSGDRIAGLPRTTVIEE